jgi:hypothetical protein
LATREIKIHQDEFDYTSKGLRTPVDKPLSLTVGSHNVVRITRPERVQLLEPGINGFAFNSSFPTPGVLQLFLVPELRASLEAALVGRKEFVRIFGHTDATGDEGANKVVSERRARAVLALLTADVQAFSAVAQDEGWGLDEAQVMLRALRCDPGPADGDMGPLTARALEVFQNQFNTGMFHRHLDSENPPTIPITSELDQPTLDALLDAFVSTLSPHIDASRLHPTHPTAGCSEFNRFGTDPRRNRRVSLALYPSLPPHHDKAPCRDGDHTACPAQEGEQLACYWYREHFLERNEESVTQRHFDLRWLFIDETRVFLTALTTVEDGGTIEFQVYRSPEISELDDLSLDHLGEALSEPIAGTILNGVAYCEWAFGEEQAEVLRHDRWVIPIPFERAMSEGLSAQDPTARVPVFTVTAGDERALSPPPLHDVSRSVWHEEHALEEPRYVWMTDALGRVYHALFETRSVNTLTRAISTSVHASSLPLK